MATATRAFDAMATAYDRDFTNTTIGRLMRNAVWARCAACFLPGMRVLEMNCGTGEDALWLARRGVQVLASDVSAGMLQVARAKLAASRDTLPVSFEALSWEELHTLPDAAFDGALSNFGGLNCVADVRQAARALAGRLKPGAIAVLCIMGPVVPWEWAWFLAHGAVAKAFRRLHKGGVAWQGVRIRYPSIARVRDAFAPEFAVRRIAGIGVLLPPPHTESFTGRFPRLLAKLDRVERRFETAWPLPLLADHYLLELQRSGSATSGITSWSAAGPP